MANNGNPHPEIQAAELYDRMYDEARAMNCSTQVLEMALCNLLGALNASQCNTDTEVSMAVKRQGHRVFEYYEKAKQLSEQRRQQEREQIDAGEH